VFQERVPQPEAALQLAYRAPLVNFLAPVLALQVAAPVMRASTWVPLAQQAAHRVFQVTILLEAHLSARPARVAKSQWLLSLSALLAPRVRIRRLLHLASSTASLVPRASIRELVQAHAQAALLESTRQSLALLLAPVVLRVLIKFPRACPVALNALAER